MDVLYIGMNVNTAHNRFSEEDHYKFYDGAFVTADEVNQCRGVTASCGIKIDENITDDYIVFLDDGTIEIGSWT
ncbi:hypothetical protein BSK59_16345 [Paenibacillus odorifer]|uniref:hypothetical protein n=1 Tax=Paenibacillus odorifer TaxID=189426 RepID=UPI00096C9200|nr:hypothetical protein [Paenibacillus odorifer]OME54148.1 hypothetical protein BSK59_16345 [Paenibacillus odorifer]